MGRKRAIVTMSCLGRNGFFGNQLFQYVFLRFYAERFGMDLQTPVWIGQYLFGHRDPPIRKKLPKVYDNEVRVEDVFERRKPVYRNVDFRGYFHFFNTSYYRPHQSFFRSLCKPIPKIQAAMDWGMERLRSRGKTLVGIHLRRGDYVNYLDQNWCYISPSTWYKEWLRRIWNDLDEPILYVASDELDTVLDDFREFNPVANRDVYDWFDVPDEYKAIQPNINGVVPSTDFYPDYYTLTQCDILAISNSTFSFSASMLNKRATAFYRPHYETQCLIPYDPWNSTPLLLKKAEDRNA